MQAIFEERTCVCVCCETMCNLMDEKWVMKGSLLARVKQHKITLHWSYRHWIQHGSKSLYIHTLTIYIMKIHKSSAIYRMSSFFFLLCFEFLKKRERKKICTQLVYIICMTFFVRKLFTMLKDVYKVSLKLNVFVFSLIIN